jgi:hypothetical protein
MADSLPESLGYLNWDKWVADCPELKCTDARALHPQQKDGSFAVDPQYEQTCANGHRFRIVMPGNRAEIDKAVAQRTEEGDRTWYPADHPLAVEHDLPRGLSVAQLNKQGREMNERRDRERGQA